VRVLWQDWNFGMHFDRGLWVQGTSGEEKEGRNGMVWYAFWEDGKREITPGFIPKGKTEKINPGQLEFYRRTKGGGFLRKKPCKETLSGGSRNLTASKSVPGGRVHKKKGPWEKTEKRR